VLSAFVQVFGVRRGTPIDMQVVFGAALRALLRAVAETEFAPVNHREGRYQ
jgi:hypothetical protein